MNYAQLLLLYADTYCEARSLARPTVSALIVRDSRAFDRVASGGSITMRNFEKAMQWFSDHWPHELDWPVGIPRPPVSTPATPAAAE